MKKKIFILIAIIILNYNINVKANSNLNIDLNTLKGSKETYSSITDLYKLPIFSDDYKEKIEDNKNKEKESKQILKDTLFSKVKEDKSKEEKIKELSENYNLFTSKSKNTNYIKEDEKLKYIIDIKFYIVICIITLLTIIPVISYKNKKNKDDINEYYDNIRS